MGIYSDRFEVISPGSLQNSMSVKKMIAGQRYTRNSIIMEIMRDYRYVDFRGMGIRTKVIPKMREFNGTAPVFEATEDYRKVILDIIGNKFLGHFQVIFGLVVQIVFLKKAYL